jgi:hypothetical protein
MRGMKWARLTATRRGSIILIRKTSMRKNMTWIKILI